MTDLAIQIGFMLLFAANALVTLIFLVRQIAFLVAAGGGQPRVNLFSLAKLDQWPTVTILVTAHNEEKVLADCLDHLVELDYPTEAYKVIAALCAIASRARWRFCR